MTKLFCDICQNPAIDWSVTSRLVLKEKAWNGSQSSQCSNVDGTWQPKFTVRPLFYVTHLSQKHYQEHPPDLCANCAVKLLLGLIERLECERKTP